MLFKIRLISQNKSGVICKNQINSVDSVGKFFEPMKNIKQKQSKQMCGLTLLQQLIQVNLCDCCFKILNELTVLKTKIEILIFISVTPLLKLSEDSILASHPF
ncbi:hypothetical protein ACKWTF_010229 [Chironomus riparius]